MQTFPDFGESDDVKQQALMAIGINDTQQVLDALGEVIKTVPEASLAKELRKFSKVIKESKEK